MEITASPNCSVPTAGGLRERVERLEAAMLQEPQVDCPIRHHFSPGIYAREINIPAGTALIGVEHKTDNLVIVSKGRLRIVTAAGTQELVAGDTFVCKAGAKNAAIALEDTRWTNIFPNPDDERETAKLVERFTFVRESDLLGGSTNLQLTANQTAMKGSAPCRLEQ